MQVNSCHYFLHRSPFSFEFCCSFMLLTNDNSFTARRPPRSTSNALNVYQFLILATRPRRPLPAWPEPSYSCSTTAASATVTSRRRESGTPRLRLMNRSIASACSCSTSREPGQFLRLATDVAQATLPPWPASREWSIRDRSATSRTATSSQAGRGDRREPRDPSHPSQLRPARSGRCAGWSVLRSPRSGRVQRGGASMRRQGHVPRPDSRKGSAVQQRLAAVNGKTRWQTGARKERTFRLSMATRNTGNGGGRPGLQSDFGSRWLRLEGR